MLSLLYSTQNTTRGQSQLDCTSGKVYNSFTITVTVKLCVHSESSVCTTYIIRKNCFEAICHV